MSAAPLSSALQVSVGSFTGTLEELGQALRAGRVLPAEVALLSISREVLARAQALEPSERAEALPPLATVIALKARLLLPQVAPADDDDLPPEEALDELLEGVAALAELDTLVSFLARRREQRSGLIAARPLPLDLPRRERPKTGRAGLAKLLKAAQNAVREIPAPLLARERLSLSDALGALRAFGERLRHFTFYGVPAQDWGERSTYFAALLEGIKEGQFEAQQDMPFADIDVVMVDSEKKRVV